MIFAKDHVEMIEVQETSDHMVFTHGQDLGPTHELNRWLRYNDETKGWTHNRTMKHIAAIPELTYMILLKERPEVLRDTKELQKWLDSPAGQDCKVCPDAPRIRGDGLQVIVR